MTTMSRMPVAQDIGYAIGAAGLVLTYVSYRIDRRRARPVVICHEDQKRTLRDGEWVALVHISNESAATAFNIRFGINIDGVHVGWKHDQADPDSSRVNVLSPNARWPSLSQGVMPLVIPDEVVSSVGADRDPDEGRSYWAYFQSPTGDWWYTSNPESRTGDLKVKRIRSRRFGAVSRHARTLDRSIRKGRDVQAAAVRELREGMAPDSKEGE